MSWWSEFLKWSWYRILTGFSLNSNIYVPRISGTYQVRFKLKMNKIAAYFVKYVNSYVRKPITQLSAGCHFHNHTSPHPDVMNCIRKTLHCWVAFVPPKVYWEICNKSCNSCKQKTYFLFV